MTVLEFIVQEIPEGQLDRHEVLISAAEIGLKLTEVRLVRPIHGHIHFSRYGQEVYVKGGFSTLIEAECRRCVEPVETHVETAVEVQFFPTDKPNPVDPLLIDTGERYYSENTIDLSEEVRQALTLEIPPWSLCSESCQGLCPHCGENLNTTNCGCHIPKDGFSPFAALTDLLSRSDRAVGD